MPLRETDFRTAARNLFLAIRAALSPSARLALRQVFNRAWYREAYPDVAASHWSPLFHYVWHGYREMRDPGPSFSTARYLRIHSDVWRAGLCPLLHYAVFGLPEGRLTGPSIRTRPDEKLRAPRGDTEMELWPADRPLVSVIVPCFNYGHTLGRCLDSLARQTFRDFEVLVIEGGSTDPASVSTVKGLELKKPSNTRFLYRASPSLAGNNRNYGIATATGKYICCLDADDMLLPSFLAAGVFLAEVEDFDIVSPSVRCFGDSQLEWLLQNPDVEKIAIANCISTASLFRREVWEKAGGYRDWGRGADHVPEDWDFWMRALCHGFRATALPASLHSYWTHEGGLSREGDQASFRRTLLDANRDLLASPQLVRAARRFANPLVNLRRRLPSRQARGVLFCMPWITMGGAENHLRAIAIGLMKIGIQVAVITTAELLPGMSDETGRFESSGAVVYNLPDLFSDSGLWPLFIDELLHLHNVETILLCGSEYTYELLPVLREQHPALRIIDQLFLDEGHVTTNRRFAGFIDLTLVSSNSLRDILKDTYGESPEKFRLIPQGLLPSFDDNAALDPALLETIRDKFVVSFIGRFSPEKAPALFLELALRLSAHSECFFLLVGDGPLRRQVLDSARALQGRFYAPGAVRNARAYIAASDVVVVPSKLEGLPGVMLESLAAGRAVVASRVGAIPEVIVHGFNGFLCDYGDTDAFLACVERLRTDAALRAAIEVGAKQSARGDFGFDAMIESYRDVLLADKRNIVNGGS